MIVFCQSSKGGTGKSVLARFTANHFIEAGQRPIVMETDGDNPDVARSYANPDDTGKECDLLAKDISIEAGFEILLDTIAKAAESGQPMVINCGARNQSVFDDFGSALVDMCKELNIRPIVMWPMDIERICVEQLYTFLQVMGEVVNPVIIKNLGMNKASKSSFDFIQTTNTGKKVPSVFFPELPQSVMLALKSPSCKAVHELDSTLTVGQRFLSRNKIKAAKTAITEALEIANKQVRA